VLGFILTEEYQRKIIWDIPGGRGPWENPWGREI
jgi:hypothetical protein